MYEIFYNLSVVPPPPSPKPPLPLPLPAPPQQSSPPSPLVAVFNLNQKSTIFSEHALQCFYMACRILCFLKQKGYSS
jgi:hypothetical protein